jgi:hypothetical protein
MDVAVPAYFHPAEAPAAWERLAQCAHRLRFVVINVSGGAGDRLDPDYLPVVARLHDNGVQTAGYVDTAYGCRPLAEVVDEVRAYQSRYGITGVFLDQSATALEVVPVYESMLLALRSRGARFVVMNHGSIPHPAYVDRVNVSVVFEGSWPQYLAFRPPEWMAARPARRFCHLVYGVPAWNARDPDRSAAGRHVGALCLSEGQLPNPWDRLPSVLLDDV